MKRHIQIVCTIGPASGSGPVLTRMVRAGMNVARINASHGDHAQHRRLIANVRRAARRAGEPVRILYDLEGYRIRIGHLAGAVFLKKGTRVWVARETRRTSDQEIPLDADFEPAALKKGMDVFADDGRLHLRVVSRSGGRVQLKVLQGGELKSRKGVNIPDLPLGSNILTKKDREDIAFAVRERVDFVAQSFVRNRRDIERVGRLVHQGLPACGLIAKIENRDGVKNIDAIIAGCDGIMIARGDLGVSLPIYKIPLIQKDIIRRCNHGKKIVITATQMLESMTDLPRPTRAEVSDVANAIFDGTDYVMLSGETAAGQFPVQSVRMMGQIIRFTENAISFHL